jgi:hypothetical protein
MSSARHDFAHPESLGKHPNVLTRLGFPDYHARFSFLARLRGRFCLEQSVEKAGMLPMKTIHENVESAVRNALPVENRAEFDHF